nr:hypothetical protein [Tanacetum cinerariifolium]
MNYIPVSTRNQNDKNAGPQDTNDNAGTQDNVDVRKEMSYQHYIVLPLCSSISSTLKGLDNKVANDKPKDDTGSKTVEEPVNKEDQAYKTVEEPVNKEDQAYKVKLDRLPSQEKEANDASNALRKESEQGCMDQRGTIKAGSTNPVNTVKEEVYDSQPLGFIDPQFPNMVYKIKKALYGLYQAPRAWFQVTPKLSHLHDVNWIFRYLKGQPKLGLWYLRDSPFDIEAYLDSDYVGANIDKKSTTGDFVDSNQMLDYGFNFMNTKIYIDNESTICIVKNPVCHSKTKHIEIRHHFIKDSYEKKLIQGPRIDNIRWKCMVKGSDNNRVTRMVFLVHKGMTYEVMEVVGWLLSGDVVARSW